MAGGLTLFERQRLQEWLQVTVKAEAEAEAQALVELAAQPPPGMVMSTHHATLVRQPSDLHAFNNAVLALLQPALSMDVSVS